MATFSSDLGWFGVVSTDRTVLDLTFAHPSKQHALAALPVFWDRAETPVPQECDPPYPWLAGILARLESYAAGVPDDLADVRIDLSHATRFQRSVLKACRRIRYGRTATYGQLAQQAGFPRAARAVGRVMASNRIPLIVPCHRIISASGALGGFSAAAGVATKRRLLDLEQAHWSDLDPSDHFDKIDDSLSTPSSIG